MWWQKTEEAPNNENPSTGSTEQAMPVGRAAGLLATELVG